MHEIELKVISFSWLCPDCGAYNETIKLRELVDCTNCKKSYKVKGYYDCIK